MINRFIAFTILFIWCTAGAESSLDAIIAIVGDEPITFQEILVQGLMVDLYSGKVDDLYKKSNLEELLQLTINQYVFYEHVKKLGIFNVSQKEVSNELNRITNRITERRFNEILKRFNVSRDYVIELIKRNILVEHFLKNKIAPSIDITDEKLRSFYEVNKKLFRNLPFKKVKGLVKIKLYSVEYSKKVSELLRDLRHDFTIKVNKKRFKKLIERLERGDR